ncbi:MAG: hypothetical protein LDL51_04140 [Chloroflexi bacterium]|nr:hypothetical protein [Chloroflexota bacterium]
MNATLSPKARFWNQALFAALALSFGTLVLPFAAAVFLVSLVMILTPVGMALAPTWSVQFFRWRFDAALQAWYLPLFGALLDLCLFYGLRAAARFFRSYFARSFR